jgi:hypothetical protein
MKHIFLAVLSLVIVLVFAGCVTTTHPPIFFDETLPDTETVTIYWAGTDSWNGLKNDVHPITYNGTDVNWEITPSGFTPIIIPAGEATFDLEGTTSVWSSTTTMYSTTTWTYTGHSISYDFAAGKTYTIRFRKDKVSVHRGQSIDPKTIIKFLDTPRTR